MRLLPPAAAPVPDAGAPFDQNASFADWGLNDSFRQSKPFTQREVVRQQCDRYPKFSWPVALYESRSPFTLGRIENYRKPDETLCQYAELKMVPNVAAVPIAGEILIVQHSGSKTRPVTVSSARSFQPGWSSPPATNIGIPANRPRTG
jgi:hypothetical protein